MRIKNWTKELCFAGALAVFSGAVTAAPIIQANAVSSNMGVLGSPIFDLIHVIEQDGLSAPYVNGVTDFDAYVPGTTHISELEEWQSSVNVTTGAVTFDFGATVGLDALALWNSSWMNGGFSDVQQFELFSDDDANFLNGGLASLGVFTAAQTANPHPSQTFTFSSASLQYLHMNIQSNYGGSASGFAGIVFRSAPESMGVPEPGTLALLGLGILGMAFSRRRKAA